MSDYVIDSSVVAKWVLPEADSASAHKLIDASLATESQLLVLDLVFPEVANAIWKQHHRHIITSPQARKMFKELDAFPLTVVPARNLLAAALEIAMEYDRAVYDALFVALTVDHGTQGVTADEPLYNVIHKDYPQIVLLRNL
jgi:predicted nucleic acid-binding protein